MFYIFCTNLYLREQDDPNGDYFPQNFFIKSNNLRDPASFSDPIYYDFYGIDPSIFFDDDGKAYVQGSFMYGYDSHFPATVIQQLEIDLNTGATLTPARDIWEGHSGIIPEGPHIYRKDGYYYLLVAEGGTFDGHMLTMARSATSVWGPYESCKRNPVLTANNDPSLPVQRVGHGELVFDGATGLWWATVLACRSGGASSYPLGRETFLTPVEWPAGEFPHFAPVGIEMEVSRPLIAQNQPEEYKEIVSLDSPETIYLRTPKLENYAQKENNAGSKTLLLTSSQAPLATAQGTITFVGRRQRSLSTIATVSLRIPKGAILPTGHCLRAGLAVYKDTNRHFSLFYEASAASAGPKLVLEAETFNENRILKQVIMTNNVPLTAEDIKLGVQSSPTQYEFFFIIGEEKVRVGACEGRHLSGNDFTGALIGIFCQGPSEIVAFNDFTVTSL